jgi:ribosomal protein S18 acetylase RimI-like enzyme
VKCEQPTRQNPMTSRRGRAEPAYRIRPATLEDTGFLADVVLAATRAQGRLPGAFDEPAWRRAFTERTRKQVGGEVPDSTTSVIESGGGRVGRLRVTRSPDRIELSGIQLLPHVQGRGIGTAIIEDLKAEAGAAGIPLEISVEKDNPRARRLYERLGCVQVAEDEQEHKLRWCPQATPLTSGGEVLLPTALPSQLPPPDAGDPAGTGD